jgi:hypothetical protein
MFQARRLIPLCSGLRNNNRARADGCYSQNQGDQSNDCGFRFLDHPSSFRKYSRYIDHMQSGAGKAYLVLRSHLTLAQQPRRLEVARLKSQSPAKFRCGAEVVFALKQHDAESDMRFNGVWRP